MKLRNWLSAALTLSTLSQAQRYPSAPDNMFNRTMEKSRTVFIAFLVGLAAEDPDQHTPLYFRRRGGIGDVPSDLRGRSPYSDTSYGYDTAETRLSGTGPWISLNLNLTSEVENLHGGFRSFIVYAVSTSPNMLLTPETDHPHRVSALGGIPWSQIRGWAWLNYDQWRMPDSLEWERNLEFDDRWHQLGMSGPQPMLSGRLEPPDALFMRHVAWHFMRFITEPSDRLGSLLSELLDWRPYAQPRDFPLLRNGLEDLEGQELPTERRASTSSDNGRQLLLMRKKTAANSLQMNILRQFNWQNLDVPEFIRIGMTGNLDPTPRLCTAALFSLRGLYFTTQKRDVQSSPSSSSSSPPPETDEDDLFNKPKDTSSCTDLSNLVKGGCDSITGLQVDFHLGNKGTNEAVGLIVRDGRSITDSVIPLIPFSASATPHQAVKGHEVDLKRVFGSDVVALRDVKYVILLDTPRRGSEPHDWTFGATCANSTQKMEMVKYSSVNEVVQNSTPDTNRQPEVVWRRDLTREDWDIKA
ncbi:putative heat-labile enterotoxin [Ophiocordyceps camponoti-saundersi (nom. inval.)]|nr:putative heat-labile enterotoxin [Ophiocordyceps camponoti-saundersi (nom. inval.)]